MEVFKAPGLYHARRTVRDTNGNTARDFVAAKAVAKLSTWTASRFSAAGLQKSESNGPPRIPTATCFPMCWSLRGDSNQPSPIGL